MSVSAETEGAEDMTIETVQTGSFSMDYLRFGHGKEALVILPGLSVQSVLNSAADVAQAYQQLAEEYTIYLLDRRKELPDSYAVQDMARDTEEALRTLGLERVCLFGASQGGMIAMEIAIEAPELVKKLAVGSATARVTRERYRTIEEWVRLAEDGDAAGLYLAFGEAVYPVQVFEQYRERLLDAAKSVTREELGRFVILAEGAKGFDLFSGLSKIACPVLVLGSMDDRVLGADAAEELIGQLKKSPDTVWHLYDGFGHAAYDIAPDYKDRLLQFFLGEEGRGRGFYISEITDEIFARMKGRSFKDDCTVPREDLRYLHVLHKNIEGEVLEGEMIVSRHIAEDVLEILKELYEADYPIERIRLIDEYDADDERSMEDNNSSCFNFRLISHTTIVSKHGLGMAVDINPLYNPYTKIADGERIIEPLAGEPYLDREKEFPYKIEKGDLCYSLFIERGFEWGGDWTNRKDYQHFEIPESNDLYR